MADHDRWPLAFRRREVLATSVAAMAGCAAGPVRADPADLPVQVEDWLIADGGEHKGERVTPEMLTAGGPPLEALPADPTTGTVREGSRFNSLLLVRLPEEEIGEDVREQAADGVLAFSAICTHQGCEVSAWMEDRKVFACFCHDSWFDPADAGAVVHGPARARLPILPLAMGEGGLVVAGEFTSPPGPRG